MLTTRQRYAPPIITKQSSGGPKVVAMFSKVASNWFQSLSTIVSKFSQSCLKIGSKLSQSFLGAVWRLFQSFFEVVWKLCQYFLKAISRLSKILCVFPNDTGVPQNFEIASFWIGKTAFLAIESKSPDFLITLALTKSEWWYWPRLNGDKCGRNLLHQPTFDQDFQV